MNDINQLLNTIEPTTLVAVLAPVGLALAVLIVMVIAQRRKINKLEEQTRPKYGFLGKPLYALLAFAILAGSFGFTLISLQQRTNIDNVGATKTLKAVVQYEVLEPQGAAYLVKFNAVPVVNDTQWGTPGSEFDVFWKITGPDTVSEVELGITETDPGGFTKLLAPGQYQIVLDVFSDQNSGKTTINILIPQ